MGKINLGLLTNYYDRRLRLVALVGCKSSKISYLAKSVKVIKKIEDFNKFYKNLLKYDLVIVNDRYYSVKKDLAEAIYKYTHEAGAVYILNKDNDLRRELLKLGFNNSMLSWLLVKSEKETPREYTLSYLDRWKDTDFLKNWEIAGKQILHHLPKEVPKKSAKIIDVGCLNCYIMETLKMHGVKHIYGIDISYEIAIKNCLNPYHLPAVTIEDFCNNSYPDNYFDLTIAFEILEHISSEKTDQFVMQLKRVTKDRGIILISTSEDMNADPTHVNCRKRGEWYRIFLKHSLVPKGRQIVFPGFNSFVLKKAISPGEEFFGINFSSYIT